MGYVLWFLVSLALVFGPFVLPGLLKFQMGGLATIIMLILGVISLVLMSVLVVITKLYQKASASEALVRTGMGGRKVIFDGGMLYIPFLHKLQRVNLETRRLDVERKGADSLLTSDNLRADMKAEFYIKVDALEEDITNAARSLGEKATDARSVENLVQDKLISALRTVAAKSTLFELNNDREKFATAVKDAVKADLKHNGLTLETVTISNLDQTNMTELNKENVFNSIGIQNAQKIIQEATVKTNELQRNAELEMAKKNVSTRKAVLETELEQKKYEAEQGRDVLNAQAESDRKAKEFKLEQEQAVAERNVEKDRAVETAQIKAKERLILTNQEKEVAEVKRQQTVQTAQKEQEVAVIAADQKKKVAEVDREKAMEVATRDKEIAIKEKEKERADAETAQLTAEVLKETQAQKVKTVEIVQQAEREKEQQVIKAKAEAETAYVSKQRAADAEAYHLKTVAAGKKEAADADAFAITRKAEADKESQIKKAEGEKALALVPVQVERERVSVSEAQVAVDRQQLEQREKYSKSGFEFDLKKFHIEQEARVRIATAEAYGEIMHGQKVTVFSNSDMMQNMMESFAKTMKIGQGLQGFYAGISQDGGDGTEAKSAVDMVLGSGLGLVDGLGDSLKGFGEFLKGKGKNFTPEQIKDLVKEFVASQKQPVLPAPAVHESGDGKAPKA